MRFGYLSMIVACVACGRLDFTPVASDAPTTTDTFVIGAVCTRAELTAITDAQPVDDQVAAGLLGRLGTACSSAARQTVSQDDPGILDATGRLLLGPGNVAVLVGGDGPQRALAYLLDADTPVVWAGTSTATFRDRATGGVIASGPVTSRHDYALVMALVEPISATPVLSLQGINSQGTVAADVWFERAVVPSLATSKLVWALVEWTDAGTDGATADDSYVVIASRSQP